MPKNKGKISDYIQWKDIKLLLNPWEKIVFHFLDFNKETFAELLTDKNDDARISSMYVGTDGKLHITFFDDYKGVKNYEN